MLISRTLLSAVKSVKERYQQNLQFEVSSPINVKQKELENGPKVNESGISRRRFLSIDHNLRNKRLNYQSVLS